MKDWPGILDRTLGSRLRALVERYQKAHPETLCSVWSHSLGQATIYQGYTVGARFQLPGGTVELNVDLAYLDRAPRFEQARVSWLEPVEELEVHWPRRIRFGSGGNQYAIPRLRNGLPRLVRGLERALARGRPRNRYARPCSQKTEVSATGAIEPSEAEVYEAVLARLRTTFVERTAIGFQLEYNRRFQANERGWRLPDALPEEPRLVSEVSVPIRGARGWRELYQQSPSCQGALEFTRVAFASEHEAFVVVHKRIGYGDNLPPMSTADWRERWEAAPARHLVELARLERSGSSWHVVDALDLLGPMPVEMLERSTRAALQEELHRMEIRPDSTLAAVLVKAVEFDPAFDFSPSGCELDAVLRDGRTYRFIARSLFNTSSLRGPVERLIVLKGIRPDRLVRAIEAWLRFETTPTSHRD